MTFLHTGRLKGKKYQPGITSKMQNRRGSGLKTRLDRNDGMARVGVGGDGGGTAPAQTADFSVCLSPFWGLNSGDPNTLPLSPWKHLDRTPVLVKKIKKKK